jgi:copper chaperone
MATTYRVNGMTCQGCARSVTNAIKAVSPVAQVTVDLDARTVAVDGPIAEDAVKQAVGDAGFEFAGKA